MSETGKKRLVTRSDFDGLVCAMILKDKGLIDDIKFVHPKDVQDGKIDLSENDITTNLPFDERAGLVFDHHESELIRNTQANNKDKYIIDPDAKSAARVVYDYYGGRDQLPHISDELMEAVDKVDSGNLTIEEVQNPTGWILVGFLMDPRTGLGRWRNFTISNYQLMEKLMQVDWLEVQIQQPQSQTVITQQALKQHHMPEDLLAMQMQQF